MHNSSRTTDRKRVLVTITPYNEQEKRVLNGHTASNTGNCGATGNASANTNPAINSNSNTSTNSSTVSSAAGVAPPPAPPAPPLPLPFKAKTNEDSVEMQSIESFKLKESPNPVIPKPPPTYFPITTSSSTASNGGSPRHVLGGKQQQQQTMMNGKDQVPTMNQASETGKNASNIAQAKPNTGKVAIRIGAYEGEAKQPSRLDFLSQQTRADKNGTDETTNSAPVVSRLQNELAATLQRSNLRRKTEGENQTIGKAFPEITTSTNEITKSEPSKLPQSTVEKLASALSNKVTIKVSPENGGR